MGKKRDKIIDLVPASEQGRPTVVTEVCGRLWRVLVHAVEAEPIEYLTCYSGAGLRNTGGHPWLCSSCGTRTEDRYSVYTPMADVLCRTCRDAGEGIPRYCCYCHQPLVPLLPIEVGGSIRLVRVCPLHHCFHVGEMEAT